MSICTRLPNTATKAELVAAHKDKMFFKKRDRADATHYRPEAPAQREAAIRAANFSRYTGEPHTDAQELARRVRQAVRA